LREVADSDLPFFYEHQADPEAARMAAMPPRDWDAFMAHWNKILADRAVIARTIVLGDKVAGNIASFPHGGRLQVGYRIGKEFWNRGIATRALREFLKIMPERPLYAHVATHNAPSLRVAEKCGFARFSEETAEDGIEEVVFVLDATT